MPKSPIFLDSNVFLYAAGSEHPLRGPCRRAIEEVAAGELAAVTSSEVVQELLHVLSRRHLTGDAVRLARSAVEVVAGVLPVRREEVALACELIERYGAISVRDAIHVATMELNGISEILTSDRDFNAIEGVRRIDPLLRDRSPAPS
jgi:predicted nucleic acid-binding protein